MGIVTAPCVQIFATAMSEMCANCESNSARASCVSSSSCASCVSSSSQMLSNSLFRIVRSQTASKYFISGSLRPVASSTGGLIMACRGVSSSGKFCGCVLGCVSSSADAWGFSRNTESCLNLHICFRINSAVVAAASPSAIPRSTDEFLAIDTIGMARHS